MLSCWHDLLFLFCLLLFYLFLPSMGWLCGVMVFGLIECPHSLPALHSGLQNNNNDNNELERNVLQRCSFEKIEAGARKKMLMCLLIECGCYSF